MMRILMMTNTYTPVVGGLERSILSFKTAFERRGHRVLVVAPTFAGMPAKERGVLRVPAIRHFTRYDLSLRLPLPPRALRRVRAFAPHLVHAHHPFLMGYTALRVARACNVPLIFTHHILFEQYTHYLPLPLPGMKRFVVELSTAYANLCDAVFAPSESLAEHLRANGVTSPIAVVPTGVSVERFARGDGAACRRIFGIPPGAFLIGHIGRLAPEKNLIFLAQAMAQVLRAQPQAYGFIAGQGPMAGGMARILQQAGVADRCRFAGVMTPRQLRDAYHAMDVFAFASQSETQGIVLVEAMASGVPVVAIDAPGVREIVRDTINGRLLEIEELAPFVQALRWIGRASAARRRQLRRAARQTAREFSVSRCATRALQGYRQALARRPRHAAHEDRRWEVALRRLHAEWELFRSTTHATGAAFMPPAGCVAAPPAAEPEMLHAGRP